MKGKNFFFHIGKIKILCSCTLAIGLGRGPAETVSLSWDTDRRPATYLVTSKAAARGYCDVTDAMMIESEASGATGRVWTE